MERKTKSTHLHIQENLMYTIYTPGTSSSVMVSKLD